ncbi:MAG: hypothetical protein PUC00_11695 [Clostridiales bacterium]|nr:hypothetical protein [Clostridiales bacterium]
MKRIVLLLLSALMLFTSCTALAADGSSNVYQGYTYDFFRNIKSTPAPFVLAQVIDSTTVAKAGRALETVTDVCTSEDGRIFVVDRTASIIYILDENGQFTAFIKNVKDENKKNAQIDGQNVTLTNPEGVFYHEKADELYVCDTGNQRILVLDGANNYAFKRAILRPENMSGETEFKPSKITVDNADRIYVVVQSSYEGIIELNEDGTFSRYFGVNEPQINMVDFLWKSIASDKQKEKMGKTYAPAFNNVALDGEGFVMAVTSDYSSAKCVFRLNFQGKNVLREMGNIAVIGDLKTDKLSAFVDIAVKPYGTYAVLDKTYGHVFLYNFDGELLCVFGSKGAATGQFKTPSTIAWLGDKLIIGDSDLKCAYIYEPTDFGTALLKAGEAYYNGEWDVATAHFEEVLRLCANLETAYVGIGKNLLMKEEYEEAMYNFKLGNNREFYSKAYKGHRTNVMKDNFWIIAIVAVVLIGAVLGSEVNYHRKQKKGARK